MSNALPKLDAKARSELRQLRNHGPMQKLLQHMQARVDYFKTALVSANPADVAKFQGRCAEMQDLIDEITKET